MVRDIAIDACVFPLLPLLLLLLLRCSLSTTLQYRLQNRKTCLIKRYPGIKYPGIGIRLTGPALSHNAGIYRSISAETETSKEHPKETPRRKKNQLGNQSRRSHIVHCFNPAFGECATVEPRLFEFFQAFLHVLLELVSIQQMKGREGNRNIP